MMPESFVLSPTPLTSTRSVPSPLTVPAMTSSSSPLPTGSDSPVIIDSLRLLFPSRIRPSTGMRSPGRTRIRSPSDSSSTPTSLFSPSTISVALSGKSLASSFSAPWALEIERISIQWPSSIIVTRVANSHQRGEASNPSSTATLKTNATVMASEIRVIIPGIRSLISPQPLFKKTSPP